MNGGHLPLSGENGILRANERLATDEEAQRMLAVMPPEVAAIYTTARLFDMRCFRLGRLQIGDVDLKDRTARIDGEGVKLCEKALALITTAIGDRKQGYVFTGPRGAQLTKERLNKTMARVKKLADIQQHDLRVLI